jgi:hypothetical protein
VIERDHKAQLKGGLGHGPAPAKTVRISPTHRIVLGGIRCASIRRDGDNLFKSYRRRPTSVANSCGSRRPRNERDRRQLHQSHDHHGLQGTGYYTNANTHAHGRTVATAQPICSGQGGNRRNQPSAQIHGHHGIAPSCGLEHQSAQSRSALTLTRLTSADTPTGNLRRQRQEQSDVHAMNFWPTVLVS